MTVFGHHDFDLDGPGPAPRREGDADDASFSREPLIEPVVIVEYRTRSFSGVLIPPALILATAALLTAYRPVLTRWLTPSRPTSVRAAKPAAPVGVEPAATPPPIVLEVKEIPVPAPEPADDPMPAQADPDPVIPVPIASESPEPPDVIDADGAAPAAAPVVAEAETPDPERDVRLALDAIRREAERIKAEQADAARLRARENDVLRFRERQAAEARERQAAEARRRAEQGRIAFRTRLLDLLRRYGDRAGPYILEMAEKSLVEPGASVEHAIAEDLKGRSDRLNRSQRVALLRSHGLPEPLILGDLIHLEQQRRDAEILERAQRQVRVARRPQVPAIRTSRPKPAVDFAAVVRAARHLLAIPPPELGPAEPSNLSGSMPPAAHVGFLPSPAARMDGP